MLVCSWSAVANVECSPSRKGNCEDVNITYLQAEEIPSNWLNLEMLYQEEFTTKSAEIFAAPP